MKEALAGSLYFGFVLSILGLSLIHILRRKYYEPERQKFHYIKRLCS